MIPFLHKAKYPDLSMGYALYLNRSVQAPVERVLSRKQYNRIVRDYCKELSSRVEAEGIADLPCDIGAIVAVNIRKRPVYDKALQKFRPARNIDWNAVRESGTIAYKDDPNTFGFVFLPKHVGKRGLFRCFGFVANKSLYKRMRKKYDDGTLPFYLADKDIYVL